MKKLFLLLLIIPFVFSSCSSTKYTSEFDPAVNFTQYKTFNFLSWSKHTDELLSDKDKKRVHDAVIIEMEKLGFVKTDAQGDLVINILLIIDEKTGTAMYNDFYTSGIGTGYYYGPWGYNNPGGVSAYTTMHSYDYKEGTLIIDLLDTKKKQLAWQGIAKGTIKSNPKSRDDGIKEIFKKLFEKFPIEVAKK